MQPTRLRTAGLTALTMVAFAANSLLCRAALADGAIDATSFTTVRVLSGALVLAVVVRARRGPSRAGSWPAAAALFVYALGFSWAYRALTAGTGALLLFGAVQATMIGGAILSGERPTLVELLGGLVASAGLVYLVLPGIASPPLPASLSMLAAGAGWGVYTLRGRGVPDATAATAGNFLRAVPFALVASALAVGRFDLTLHGALLAATSGAVTSGLGYALWYVALRGHTATSAAIAQLAVPLLAALGGVALLAEPVTTRLLGASVLILGGVAAAVLGRRRR